MRLQTSQVSVASFLLLTVLKLSIRIIAEHYIIL